MTTDDTQKEATQTEVTQTDPPGSLADSARRHLAYEALSRHVALSEAALQRVLEAIARCQGATGSSKQEGKTDDDGDRS